MYEHTLVSESLVSHSPFWPAEDKGDRNRAFLLSVVFPQGLVSLSLPLSPLPLFISSFFTFSLLLLSLFVPFPLSTLALFFSHSEKKFHPATMMNVLVS